MPPLTPQSLRVAGKALGFTDEAGEAIRQLSKPIRAYHGSPHSFDAFDASKIGTGEGAQSYGHGLYFAGNESVADSYRRKLAEDADAPERWARDYWEALAAPDDMGTPEGAYESLMQHIAYMKGYSPGERAYFEAAEKFLRSQSPSAVPPPLRQGHMYEVEIGHPEESLLDLDAPVRGQPQVIQDALGGYAKAPEWFSLGQEGWSGKNAYTRMAGEMAAANPRIVGGYHVTHDKPAASAALLRSGVPGIRYLDGGSRATGDGTHNYVIFPGAEDKIRILRKYGLLLPAAAAGTNSEE
jgi:hypothetical protein